MQDEANTAGQPTPVAGQVERPLGMEPERESFERYFVASRRSRGPAKRPTFERLGDDTYADDHTQRHWWTWQQAQAAERERWRDIAKRALPMADALDSTRTAVVWTIDLQLAATLLARDIRAALRPNAELT